MLHYLEDKRIIKKIFGFDKSYKITKEEMEVRKEFLKQLINDYGYCYNDWFEFLKVQKIIKDEEKKTIKFLIFSQIRNE